jgi:HEAT repeat protein
MIRQGWLAPLLMLACAGCSVENVDQPGSYLEVAKAAVAARSQEVASALEAIRCPSQPRAHVNEPPCPTKMYLRGDYYDDCPDAIDLLTRTEQDVEDDLLLLARDDARVPARCRAVRILAARKSLRVIPLLAQKCQSKDVEERYLMLSEYTRAIEEKHLPPPTDFTPFLQLYSTEKDEEIRERLEWFFGTAKAKEAVQVLLDTERQGKSNVGAVWALGEIGDPRAVPIIIKKYATAVNEHYYMEALGKLATPEGVDFIISHLGGYCAPEALHATGSKKALPALEAHLQQALKKGNQGDNALNIAATRIAIIRLRDKDPAASLVALVADVAEEKHARHDAVRALEHYELKRFHPRLLALYKNDSDPFICRMCMRYLSDSNLDGVTEAMTDAFLNPRKNAPEWEVAMDLEKLKDVLNKRLGTFFREREDLAKYLRTRASAAR